MYIMCTNMLPPCTAPDFSKEFTLHNHHCANVVPLGTAKSRVASELLISTVLQLISQHSTLVKADAETAARSAATIEHHLKTLAGLPGMEPILRATCQQLSEQWGMMHEQQLPKPTSSALFTRLISGPAQHPHPHRTN
jgi:hypothetical protein